MGGAMAIITPDQAAELKNTIIEPALVEATHYASVTSGTMCFSRLDY
jgi:hypothetical protein